MSLAGGSFADNTSFTTAERLSYNDHDVTVSEKGAILQKFIRKRIELWRAGGVAARRIVAKRMSPHFHIKISINFHTWLCRRVCCTLKEE
jgi:hypothetical protein